MRYTLTPFTPHSAGLVAGWSISADEADMWCSRAEHPFPAEVVAGWADNTVALATYRGAGFEDVAAELQAEWNAPQPRPYTWLRHTGT